MKNLVLICAVALICGGLIMGCKEEKKVEKAPVKITTDDGYVRCSVEGCEKHAVCQQELTLDELKATGLEDYAGASLNEKKTGVFRCFCETHGKERNLSPVPCHVCGAPAVRIPYVLFSPLLPGYVKNTFLLDQRTIHLPTCEKHRDEEEVWI